MCRKLHPSTEAKNSSATSETERQFYFLYVPRATFLGNFFTVRLLI